MSLGLKNEKKILLLTLLLVLAVSSSSVIALGALRSFDVLPLVALREAQEEGGGLVLGILMD